MKTVAVLLACCLALVAAQTSTNPEGTSYFSPSLVRTLNISDTVYGTIPNGTYQDFWQVFVPANVGAVRYIVNNTSPSGESNYIEVQVNYITGAYDNSVSFPCYYGTSGASGAACYDYDDFLEAYTGNYDTENVDLVADDFLPGTWQYVTVNRYYDSGADVTYALKVEPTWVCDNSSSVTVLDYSDFGCLANSAITNVTSSGSHFHGDIQSTSQLDAYRIDVPKNVSRVWAWVVSPLSYLYIEAAQSFVPVDYSYAAEYTYSGSYNSTTATYSYFLQMDLPNYDLPVFFTVQAYSSSYFGTYNVSFYWSACGASSAGFGDINNYYGSAESFFDVPDCSDPVTFPSINATSFQTLTFQLPKYNSSVDYGYAGNYGFFYVPQGTVGSINFTCNGTSDDTRVVFAKNKPVDCYSGKTVSLYCTGPTYSSSYYYWLLSEDLYSGGYWSVGACSDDSTTASTVTLVSNGYIPAVAASPSSTPAAASASSSPAAGTSASSSPGSSASSSPGSVVPSASSSPGSDSDSDSSVALIPLMVMIALAVVITL